MQFDENGKLIVPKKKKQDHITIFQLISELDFPVGKKLLISLLQGEETGKIKKLELDKKVYYGSLAKYETQEIDHFITKLIKDNLLQIHKRQGKYPVVQMTPYGNKEFNERKLDLTIEDHEEQRSFTYTEITEQDKELFKQLDFFLNQFTDEQKKAITDKSSKQLCVAGAGSGKTRVLTYKIVYLVKFCGVKPKNILAITFTRKAKQEMISRLSHLGIKVRVETFNSYAEQELQKHCVELYGQDKKMVGGSEYVNLVVQSLQELGFSVEEFLQQYFNEKERQNKEQRQLFFSFLYDLRTIHDAYIISGKKEDYFESRIETVDYRDKVTAKLIEKLILHLCDEFEKRALRTYGDQLVDIITLYKSFPDLKPQFSWMLVDEYQDVSDIQTTFIDLLNPNHIFAVGDPRQSIYAWRGAQPSTIYEFATENTTVMQLTKNFRSTNEVVDYSNKLIKKAKDGKQFSNLKAHNEEQGKVTIKKYSSEQEEARAIVKKIKETNIPRNEIFVLSRTNKGLEKVAEVCKQENIKYLLRTDERKGVNKEPSEFEVTLSTVHAIKGLEAEMVFVLGTNTNNYPCRAKDHRFVDLLGAKEAYDQYEEERRILYVAITRAKEELHISYTGASSPFITTQQTLTDSVTPSLDFDRLAKQRSRLKRWRYLEAQERDVPAYIIFSDKVLEQLLNNQPLTTDDLYMISGLGKTKIKEFGEDMLNILHKS